MASLIFGYVNKHSNKMAMIIFCWVAKGDAGQVEMESENWPFYLLSKARKIWKPKWRLIGKLGNVHFIALLG